jgi:uncharacterized protein (TIGR02246 family)
MADFEATWNAHDMKAFAELLTSDADFVVINGKHLHGRDAIYQHHDELHRTTLRNRVGQNHIEDIRFIRPEVAIMHVTFEGRSASPEDDSRGRTSARATVVVVKVGSKWLITAFHNTLVMDPDCRVSGGVFICPDVR